MIANRCCSGCPLFKKVKINKYGKLKFYCYNYKMLGAFNKDTNLCVSNITNALKELHPDLVEIKPGIIIVNKEIHDNYVNMIVETVKRDRLEKEQKKKDLPLPKRQKYKFYKLIKEKINNESKNR